MSDDGQHAITLIAFVGSVFSPYYARSRREQPTDPEQHCAFNVALYGRSAKRWAMTERRASSLERRAHQLVIGPSAMRWDNDTLVIDVDEWSCPVPRRVRGTIRVRAQCLVDHSVTLSEAGGHRWTPIAPTARIEVALSHPDLRWSGCGYFDSNSGDDSLERAFNRWDWSRALLADGSTAVLYDVERRTGDPVALALSIGRDGSITPFEPPPSSQLATTSWGIGRSTRCEAGGRSRVLESFENGPFYARALVGTQLFGETVRAVHESLSLDRFRQRWVQELLPFRMPRALR